jgi:hypothetical protein
MPSGETSYPKDTQHPQRLYPNLKPRRWTYSLHVSDITAQSAYTPLVAFSITHGLDVYIAHPIGENSSN